jgi:signal transduction histidine kinase
MFNRTRLKLTAWYLLIIMVVSLTFSIVIARGVIMEVERFERMQRFRIENDLRNRVFFFRDENIPDGPVRILIENPDLLTETKNRVLLLLGLVNGAIFVVSGGLGYFLAGRTLEPIKNMIDDQNRFVSDASHELRTPLTSLKTAFEVYLRNKNPSRREAGELVRESITEVNKLQNLTDSLLQLAQYEKAHNGKAPMEEVSLSQTVVQAVRKIMPVAKGKGVKIDISEIPYTVKGNRWSLVDLLVILIDNAVKYSKNNGKVDIWAIEEGGYVDLFVKDRGIGIEKKDIPFVFERFYRADSARSKENTPGYGLGLSIAQKIVREHNGSLRVQSDSGVGSVFTVRLPLYRENSV